MRLEEGDVVVARVGEKGRRALCVAKRDSKGPVYSLVEADRHWRSKDAATFWEVEAEDLLANLGPNPNGEHSVYGVKPHLYRGSFTAKGWGEVEVWRDLGRTEVKVISEHLSLVADRLKRRNLDGFFPIVTEIRPAHGQWAGYYDPTKDSRLERGVDVLCLHPKDFLPKGGEHDEGLEGLILHEAFHGVWFRTLPARYRARWVALYNKVVLQRRASVEEIHKMFGDWVKRSCSKAEYISHLRKEYGEDAKADIALLNLALSWIEKAHKINQFNLSDMIKSQELDIRPWLPSVDLFIGKADPVVSDYGAKKAEEMWSEAAMFSMLGRPLHEPVEELLTELIEKVGGYLR